jgi:eukaryotic-like serine/threonine-protein kinase
MGPRSRQTRPRSLDRQILPCYAEWIRPSGGIQRTTMALPSLDAGIVIASRYRIEKALAVGGMGSIWVARHVELDSLVAIKFMVPSHAESSTGRERFKREAKICAELRVPNVVQVYDYGIEDDTPYLVMELLEGEDLQARIRRERRLTPAVTLGIVHQVSKALERAHGLGLVHRDIKPANIFLARQGGEEVVKVLDFGIAKSTAPLLAGNATKTGTLLGSPYYMSPEQVRRSKQVDHRSDLWALGVIVYECLTGRRPIQGEELGEVLVEICTGEIPLASTVVPELGPGVDAFLSRALAREQDQRFQSARELTEAFAAVVASLAAPRRGGAPGGGAGHGAAGGSGRASGELQRAGVSRRDAVGAPR